MPGTAVMCSGHEHAGCSRQGAHASTTTAIRRVLTGQKAVHHVIFSGHVQAHFQEGGSEVSHVLSFHWPALACTV